MLGKQDCNTDLFQCVTMEQLVPQNHLLRRLHSALDLSFVRDCVAAVYSTLGRHSVDPEVVVRMWILQHLYGFSEREVCDEVSMHAGFRWFCGLSFNDPVPDQSTLVKLRNHKWAETGLWEAVLNETVRICEAAGIARPDRMALDGTQITARAATSSLEAIPPVLEVVEQQSAPLPAEPAAGPVALSVEEGGAAPSVRKSGDPDWHGEHFSNKTHRSTTDPEARLYRKSGGQEARLRFLGHYLIDRRGGVIYGACATQASGLAEREAGLSLLDGLSALPDDLAMDLGYRDGEFLADVLERGVTPLVPLGKEPLEAEPVYQRTTNDIQTARNRKRKQAAAGARNLVRLIGRSRRATIAQKQRTRIEHLYGEAKEHHGLGRAQGWGVERLDKQIKLTATVQNMKRLLASRRLRTGAVQAATAEQTRSTRETRRHLVRFHAPTQRISRHIEHHRTSYIRKRRFHRGNRSPSGTHHSSSRF